MRNIFKSTNILLIIFWKILFVNVVLSWNTDELEVFDAVDEIKQDFYALLDVPKNANVLTIKKSFRKLSLAVHPDHNPSPTADIEFRNLALVYDILKNPEKRKYYDNILENGLPDWRQAVYYYRRVRKMGLQEMCFILAVIVSIGQYLIAWAVYLEKRLTLKELLKTKGRKFRKLKKNKDGPTADDIIDSAISKPSVRNTLPFQVCSLFKNLCVFIVMFTIQKTKSLWNRPPPVVKEPVKPRPEFIPKPVEKPKKVDFIPQLVEDKPELRKTSPYSVKTEIIEPAPTISGGLWTDDDIVLLVKLVNKHPAGEFERWVKIASAMGRTVAEVTFMANKIKENDFRLPTETEEEPVYQEPPKKVKTKGGKLGVKIIEAAEDQSEKNEPWTQIQQKAFEQALNKYSRKSANDRWEKIANCVPGKTKEECILRYKKITAAIQQRKLEEMSNSDEVKNETDEKKNDAEGGDVKNEVEESINDAEETDRKLLSSTENELVDEADEE